MNSSTPARKNVSTVLLRGGIVLVTCNKCKFEFASRVSKTAQEQATAHRIYKCSVAARFEAR